MPLPSLDPRLAAAAALVLPGQAVADIGCDHGKLTVALAASGLYPRVIGADLRPGPLAKARAAVQKAQCGAAVQLRLGDGLSVLRPGEVGTVVIAGVSAQTIWQMLERTPWAMAPGAPRFVLAPATRHAALRRWLWQNGFDIIEDRPVCAAGRQYAVMAAEYTGQRREASFRQCLYGGTGAWPGGAAYAAWQRAKLPKLRRGVPEGSALAAEIDAILREE